MAGAWGVVGLALLVALIALALVGLGVLRSLRALGPFNGRVFSRPAAPLTIWGLGLVLLDGAALLIWLLVIPR